ncbi:MAG: hypothetical protein H0V24_12320 [Chloroflexia bacterium]|nr:hypothetical protein [Chloroflexia bacterium]
MTDTSDTVDAFFERYAAALLARDERAIAGKYAIPSLIVFSRQLDPGQRRQADQGVLGRLLGPV